jgi:hypothetical protein
VSPHRGDGNQSALPVLADGPPALSTPERQRFAELVQRIEIRRAMLLEWRAVTAVHEQRVAGRLQPWLDRLRAARIALVHVLDRAIGHSRLGKASAVRARRILLALAEVLLAERADDGLRAVHDFHSDLPYPVESAATLPTDGRSAAPGSPGSGDNLHAQAELSQDEQAQAIADHADAEWQARAEHARTLRSQRRPSKRVRAEHALREQSALGASQAIRAVYRKLAMALHPDREADEARRALKTALLCEANQAYAARDLLTLLELQGRIAQVDAASLAGLGTERLKQYNQVLEEQLDRLDQALAAQMRPFLVAMAPGHDRRLTPARVLRALDADIRATRQAAEQLESELLDLRTIALVKDWLR